MTFFAVKVQNNKELEAKKAIEENLKLSDDNSVSLVKEIHTFQKEIVSADTKSSHLLSSQIQNEVNTDTETNKMIADSLASSKGNLQKQYDALKGKNDEASLRLKPELKENIKSLDKEIEQYRTQSKKIKPLMPGYVIIELHSKGLNYLPTKVWDIITKSSFVSFIPSRLNIPSEEIKEIFKQNMTESEIELCLGEVEDSHYLNEKETMLVHEANTSVERETEQRKLKELEKLNQTMVASINEKKDVIDRIKAFIRNKKQIVTMPVSLFYELYDEYKEKKILPSITVENIISRINKLLSIRKSVALE